MRGVFVLYTRLMFSAFVFGIFGLIVGSFLNVVIIRHGVRSVGGRSACMACGRRLLWHDMVPVASWALLRGKCRACKARISVQYPLVEAAAGIAFALLGAAPAPLPARALDCIIAALLIAIAAYDWRHTIIPDQWAYAFAGLAFISPFFAPPAAGFSWLPFLFAGPVAAVPLFALWFFSRGQWMGLGDAKLALGIGWLLGSVLGIFAVFLAFVIGALVSAPLLFFSSPVWKKIKRQFTPTPTSRKLARGFTMKSEIPFGPFLIVSCFIVWIFLINGVDLVQAFGLLP
jgi:leader peptidase (prepilin peptidase)/N-methyltransferase